MEAIQLMPMFPGRRQSHDIDNNGLILQEMGLAPKDPPVDFWHLFQ